MRQTTDTSKTIKQLLFPPIISVSSLNHGIENEKPAIMKFEQEMSFKVDHVIGLFVDEDLKFLAASPDGLIGNDGIIEVKCPDAAKDFTEGIEKKIISYCTLDNGGKMKLKVNHNYYYQVQGQLHITKRRICYFIVYTTKDIVYDLITRDDNFWDTNMADALEKFYVNAVLPELVDSRHKRNMPIRNILRKDF